MELIFVSGLMTSYREAYLGLEVEPVSHRNDFGIV